ncbi:hypothetical protein BHE74_00054661 [Ensete ventricosum]|nr:hypothetical protein BHE74_00054661 [Ensete ventricosum]
MGKEGVVTWTTQRRTQRLIRGAQPPHWVPKRPMGDEVTSDVARVVGRSVGKPKRRFVALVIGIPRRRFVVRGGAHLHACLQPASTTHTTCFDEEEPSSALPTTHLDSSHSLPQLQAEEYG